jgi:hypothetical protein
MRKNNLFGTEKRTFNTVSEQVQELNIMLGVTKGKSDVCHVTKIPHRLGARGSRIVSSPVLSKKDMWLKHITEKPYAPTKVVYR